MRFNGFMPLDKQSEKRNKPTAKEKQLIDNIKHARQDANITQEDLSYRIGKNSNYMGMVESYRRGISFRTLFKIADALSLKVKAFFENI